MHVVGIVAEFNPFHGGHGYLIDKIKEKYPDSLLISVMSGNFVQRGEPALYDKWRRSRVAVENGIDLVVQLPTRFSNASSYFFSYGAIEILNSLGVNTIAFGSEIGYLNKILEIANVLYDNSSQLNEYAASKVKDGISFPKARDEFLKSRLVDSDLFSESNFSEKFSIAPNDILGIDYILSSKKISYDGDFFVVKRKGLEHNLSASIIRDNFYSQNPDLLQSLQDRFLAVLASKMSAVISNDFLQTKSTYDFELYNTLKKEWRTAKNMQDIENLLVNKMHTRARVRRFLISILIGVDTPYDSNACGYNLIYPLAFNTKGARYLKEIKNNNKINIGFLDGIKTNYINLDESLKTISEEEIRATDIYNILMSNDLYKNCEFVMNPQFIEMQP